MPNRETSRRDFLSFLAGSPLLAAAGLDSKTFNRLFSTLPRGAEQAMAAVQQLSTQTTVIKSAKDALDVLDFEAAAKAKIPVAHWGYLSTGTDDDATIRANREGYERWALRPRRLVDLSRFDTSVSLYGTKYATPIVVNPVGSQKAFNAIGEIGTARAAKAKDHLMVLSNVATTSIEDAIAARGGPVWFQLYWQKDWSIVKQVVQRAERAGAPALVFTVDLLGGSNRETMVRYARLDTRHCLDCHKGGPPLPGVSGRVDDRDNSRKPNLYGYPPVTPMLDASTPTWEYIERLKSITKMKVLVKGIVTKEDAEIAVQKGVDGIFVSNHGGRAESSLRATVTSLPDVVQGVAGRIPVICDGGVRRGTDVYKALALGATASGIGRPYIWGLGAFGQEGVETVLALLRKELETVMKQSGTPTLASINREHITPR